MKYGHDTAEHDHEHNLTEHEKKQIQAELDMAQGYVIECLCGHTDIKQMRIDKKYLMALKFQGTTLPRFLNCQIDRFEMLVRPHMLPNGMVDVESAAETLCHFMGWELEHIPPMPVKEMRLVDFMRRFDKPLRHIGRHIQGLEHVPHKAHNPY